MKIVAIIPEEKEDASSWWRIKRPLIMLRSFGFSTSWLSFADTGYADFKDAIVILHRIIPGQPEQYIEEPT
jgi:hypothetical protein